MGEMSWVGKKIHLYNVTMGLYMLDWWERCLFSILPFVLGLFVLGLIPLLLQFVIKLAGWQEDPCFALSIVILDFFFRIRA
jgi:hypothetical protein